MKAWIFYDVVTPESAEEGDTAERGCAAPGGWRFPMPDDLCGEPAREWLDSNALTPGEVLRWALSRRGHWTWEPGSSVFYDEGDPDCDFATGAETRYQVSFCCGPSSKRRIARLLGCPDVPARLPVFWGSAR